MMQEQQDKSDDEKQAGFSEANQGPEPTVESVVEAVLFASDEPLKESRLADIVGTRVSQIRKHVKNLNDKYRANGNVFRIEQIAGGFQMLTLSSYNHSCRCYRRPGCAFSIGQSRRMARIRWRKS